jgi:hypothetical protein
LALSAGFGLVSSLGVIYQIKDIRNKAGKPEQTPVAIGAVGPAVPVPGPMPGPTYGPPPGTAPVQYPVASPGPAVYPPPGYPAGPPGSPVEPPTNLIHPGSPSGPGSVPAPGSAPPYPMSPPAGPSAFGSPPPAYPPSAYTVPPGVAAPPPMGGAMLAGGQPPIPRSIARVRLLLLALTILMIPNVALWMYSSILSGAYTSEEFNDPMTYVGIVGAMIILVVPLATIPTVLSWQIGRGRNWARIVATVFFAMVGPFCSCFGLFLPFSSVASAEGSVSTSPVMDAALGVFSLALGVISILVVVNVFLPPSNQFFRAMAQWRTARAYPPAVRA